MVTKNITLTMTSPFWLKSALRLSVRPGIFSGFIAISCAISHAESESRLIEELVVTGARSVDRSVFNSAVPIDILTSDSLRTGGVIGNELGQSLSVLVPSFNFPRQSNSGTSDHVRAGQLRGLSPDQVLVLVNGKRRHTSAVVNTETKIGRGTAATDFNTIPLGAVERVEILRDGAGAQYGSDAIAGVVNVLLNDSPEGASFNATYGAHHTTPDTLNKSLTDGETINVEGDIGFKLGADGFLRVGAEYEKRNATNRAGFDQIPFFTAQTPANLALQGQRNYSAGDPDVTARKLWFNGAFSIGDMELYGFGTYAQRDSAGATFFRYPDDTRNQRDIYPHGFLPVTTGDNEDLALTTGLRRTAGKWVIDSSISLGRNEFAYGVENSLNASLGPESPTSFKSGSYINRQITANLDISRPIPFAFFSAPINLASGLEYRRENYSTVAGEPASYSAGTFNGDIGAQGAPGLTPDDEADINRDVMSVYVDASANVTDRIFINLAGRYEHYSDFGDALTGKASAIYEISPQLSFRGAVSNNLRSPALSQMAFSDRTINFGTNRTLVTTRTVPVDSAIAQALGAEDLAPEKSFNLSAGILSRVNDNLSLSFDAYRIRVNGRITLSDRLFGPALENFVQSLPNGQGVQSIRFFTNAIDTRTLGLDMIWAYHREFLKGEYNFNFAYSYSKTDIVNTAETPRQLSQLDPGFSLIGVEEINTIEEAAPRSKIIMTNRWENEKWSLLMRVSYFGSTVRVFNFGGGFEPRQKYGAEISVDADFQYNINSNVSISVGGINLFDNYPDKSSDDINFFGNLPYDILSPIGVNGRYIYTRFSFHI